MEGIEPHWNKIRPMVLPFADIFNPPPPLKIDMDTNSQFYNELMEVYRVGKQVTEDNNDSEEAKIAAFWDCNPYVSHHKGHAMFATKKLLQEVIGLELPKLLLKLQKILLMRQLIHTSSFCSII